MLLLVPYRAPSQGYKVLGKKLEGWRNGGLEIWSLALHHSTAPVLHDSRPKTLLSPMKPAKLPGFMADTGSSAASCAQCGAPLPANAKRGENTCLKCLFLGVLGEKADETVVDPNRGAEESASVERQIGPYTLLEVIAEGGMGEVFIAEQKEPVRRLVALKVVKLGMDTKEVLQRFDAERQALAMMEHPHIARVFDAGTAPSGRPYFVMELVEGEPITDFCDRNRLNPRRRLELFVKVCQAIQHAHQRGIIHRDLKPSNILVEEDDHGHPTPKVIDFGIAKATDRELTQRTLETQVGDLLGTPQYMSPEQALGDNDEIDTRSDIYSLGVILYELLTGHPPISAQQIQTAGILGVGKLILESEPARPSAKIRTLGKEAETVATQRGTDSTRLTRTLRQELDWVTLKCLEKDKERRYASANALARELERHLSDEVVEARPPTVGYRIKKTIRRNRVAVIAGSLVLLAILAGAGLAVWQAIEAQRSEAIAIEERENAITERENAEELIGFMLGDLHEKLSHRAQTELLVNVGDAVEEYFSNLDETGPRPISSQRLKARMYYMLAEINLTLGDSLVGTELSNQGLDLYREIADEFGSDPTFQTELAEAILQVVENAWTSKTQTERLALIEKGIATLGEVELADVPNRILLAKLIRSRVDRIYELGRIQDAITAGKEVVDLSISTAIANPENREALFDEGKSLLLIHDYNLDYRSHPDWGARLTALGTEVTSREIAAYLQRFVIE